MKATQPCHLIERRRRIYPSSRMLRVAKAPPRAYRLALAHRVRQTMRYLPWLPALIGAAYLVLFLARLPRLIERVYWETDAANAAVLAESVGHGGTVILERFGWFTAMWFALLTRPLPAHRQIWEVGPYLFSLAAVALLAWASWRLAGRWAAAMTATLAVATTPYVSYALVTLNFHSATWTATVILAVFCLWVAYEPPLDRLVLVTVLMTALAGTTLASDLLFLVVGLIPYALTGALMTTQPRVRASGVLILVSAGVAALLAWATKAAMTAAHIRVFPVPTRWAADKDLWPSVGRLLKGVVQLFGGDYFFDSQLTVRTTLSFACALLALAALAAPFVLIRREFRSRASVPLLVYTCFWAGCVAFNSITFVLSSEGSHGGYYLFAILYAIAATAPLLLAGNRVGRLALCVGVSVVATFSLVNLADTKTSLRPSGRPPVASVADQIVDIARKENALYGYADYWDATSLTWSKHYAVHVFPAVQCEITQGKTDLCGYWFNVNTNWYRPHAGKTFVIRDRLSGDLRQTPPPTMGSPTATYDINDVIRMYVYPDDVVNRFISVPK